MRAPLVALFLFLTAPLTAQEPDAALLQAQQAFERGAYDDALSVIEPAARAGDALAQMLLGTAYETGQGKDQAPQLAQDWYRKSAAQGHGPAMLALGLIAMDGRDGIAPDPQAARNWLDQAMAQGQPLAFLARAQMMLDGENPAAAAALLLTALELGAPQAGIVLAGMYRDGQGVAQDAGQARRVLSRAAQQGHAPAMAELAVMYELGQGGPADPAVAFALYQEAVNLGDAGAAVNLALFMQENDGYWRDPPLAHAYCLWGSSNAAEEVAGQYRAQCAAMAAELTEQQRAEGERLAATF